MKTLFILYTLLTVESLKFCANCKFYKPWIEWPADKTMGKCTYFPIVYKESYNIVSGELIEGASDYEFCGKARIYENLCGKSGKYYTPNSSGDRRSPTELSLRNVGGVNATRPKNNDSSTKNLKTVCDL